MTIKPFIALAAVLLSLPSALAQPTIQAQPKDASVSLGATIRFGVSGSSTSPPITYQWWFKDAAINPLANPSAAYNILSLTNVAAASDGPYFVVIADASGMSVTSRVASLTVDRAFTKITTGLIVTDLGDWQSSARADYDADGFLDLFIGGIGSDALYRNNRDGTFTRVSSAEVGLQNASTMSAVVWGDYDNDGDPDLFVAAYSGQNNLLYQNRHRIHRPDWMRAG